LNIEPFTSATGAGCKVAIRNVTVGAWGCARLSKSAGTGKGRSAKRLQMPEFAAEECMAKASSWKFSFLPEK